MPARLLPRLHILTDTAIQSRHSHFELAKAAFEAGDIAVQYRNKSFDRGRDLAELQAIAHLARESKRLLIVNDHPGLALEVGAGGVHLGLEDGGIEEARALLGPEAIIGATVHTPLELEAALQSSADYLGIGPVFGSKSKETGLPPLGTAGLHAFARASHKPVIAIGNIQLADITAVMTTGVHGIAVISAYCMSDVLPLRAIQLLHALPLPH